MGTHDRSSPTETPSLTLVQQRTADQLIRGGRRWDAPEDLAEVIAQRLETAVSVAAIDEPLVLTKARLSDAGRCDGRFEAGLLREAPPFAHSTKTASGLLLHKAVELDVGGRLERDPYELTVLASDRLVDDDAAFGRHWGELPEVDRDQLLMRSVTALELFRTTFPPLRSMRTTLAPMTEWRLRAEVSGGRLVLDGRIDLSLGRPAGPEGRLLLDIKGEGAWPEHAEDLRFYALVHTLRFGVPPSRVASVFLASGTWQVEDVTQRVLDRAIERIEGAIALAGRLRDGDEPSLRPGRYCAWCPRVQRWPAAARAAEPAVPAAG
ncbi:MAG: PD-(D/E)XK nuclease family protein [Actinomycetota bacterium]